MAAWYGALSVQLNSKISSLIKMAMKITEHKSYPYLQTIYEEGGVVLASSILPDPSHILYSEYELLLSRKRFRASKCKRNRYKLSFLPTSLSLLNKLPVLPLDQWF